MSKGTGMGVIDDVINVGTQLMTGGLVGYSKNGIGAGITGEAAIDATKEVTGANAAEEANALARQQYEDSVEAARVQRQDAITRNARNQVAASQGAGAARTFNRSGNNSSQVIGDVSDFLGL